jgi:cell division control protein 7
MKGVLVDFGLAQFEEEMKESAVQCQCMNPNLPTHIFEKENLQVLYNRMKTSPLGYLKRESRPRKDGERSGTRGYRAPEVLFRCSTQTTAIDIWSVGIILLSFLLQITPLFGAEDDLTALVELTHIFGTEEMTICAAKHCNTTFSNHLWEILTC